MKNFALYSLFTLLAGALCITSANGQSSYATWAKTIGGAGSDVCRTVATDAQGNVYISGTYTSSADFDPGPGVFQLNAISLFDAYICKLSPNGNFLWARSFGGTVASGQTGIFAIDFDATGNVIIGGRFAGVVDFDPSPAVYNLTSNGGDDAFVAKLDQDGDFIWAKNFGGIGADWVSRIALDASGNIFFTGAYTGVANFDPGVGTFNLSALGVTDIYIVKLNNSGDLTWAKSVGGIGNDNGFSLVLDNTANIYAVMTFSGSGDFDPGAGVYNLTSVGALDAAILKLDANGDFVWAISFGGSGADDARSIVIDKNGDLIVSGKFTGTTDFDPSAGIFEVISAGSADVFVGKYSPFGNLIWAKGIGGTGLDQTNAVVSDALGNVYVSGFFPGTIDLDPGPSVYPVISAGSNDMFLVKLDEVGNFIWGKSWGGPQGDQIWATEMDKQGNILISGTYSTIALDIDGHILLNKSTTGSSADVLVAKLCNSAPANDDVCNAQPLTIGSWATFSNSCATAQAGEPLPPAIPSGLLGSQDGWLDESASGPSVDNSVWFSFIAPSTAAVNIQVMADEAPFNTQIALYSSDNYLCNGNFTLIAANDDANSAIFSSLINRAYCLEKGKQYFVQVDGYQKSVGSGSIRVTAVSNKVMICHNLTGNNAGAILVSGCSLPDHLGHGDVIGPCPGTRVIMTSDENLFSQSLVVYPNPTKDEMNISFESEVETACQFVITDVMGRMVMSVNQIATAGHNQNKIDLSAFVPGVYSLSIISGDAVIQTKVVKE